MINHLKKYRAKKMFDMDSDSSMPWELKHFDRCSKQLQLKPSTHWDIVWNDQKIGGLDSISKLHNTTKGDCFIIGTGPSVSRIDFASLKDKTCIGVNGSIIKFIDCGFAPDYYVITTSDFFETRNDLVRLALESGAKCFFPFWGISKICEKMPNVLDGANVYLTDSLNQRYLLPRSKAKKFYQYVKNDNDFILNDKHKKSLDKVGFSLNVAKGYFHGENVVYTAMQHAYYFGYRRLFLVGMDLNYDKNKPRFYEENNQGRPSWLSVSFKKSIVPCFEIVRDMITKGMFEVYNLSSESKLSNELVEKMSFKNALSIVEQF